MPAIFLSPQDVLSDLAKRAREARLAADFTQAGLASRAGVSTASLKRFEQTGAASLETVVRIAFVLRLEQSFHGVFQRPALSSLTEILEPEKKRQRGRRK